MDVEYYRGREVGERRAHDGVRVTIVRCGQGRVRWTNDILLAVHFEIGLYCVTNYEHSLNLCLHWTVIELVYYLRVYNVTYLLALESVCKNCCWQRVATTARSKANRAVVARWCLTGTFAMLLLRTSSMHCYNNVMTTNAVSVWLFKCIHSDNLYCYSCFSCYQY